MVDFVPDGRPLVTSNTPSLAGDRPLLIVKKVGTAKVLRLTLLDNQSSDLKTFYDTDGRPYRN